MILRVIIFFIISTLSFSEVLLTTDNNNPGLDEAIKITVAFNNTKREQYYLDGINNFDVLYRSSRSSTSWVNGKKTSVKSDIYTVMPSKTGNFDLSVWIKGQLKSNRLRISVTNVSKNKKNGTIGQGKVLWDVKKLNKNYYFGEKIPYYEKATIKTSLRNYGYINPPVFQGFTAKDVTKRDKNGYPVVKRLIEKGKEEIEIKLTENILEANSTGEKKIKVGKIKAEESTDDFFGIEPVKPMLFGGKEISVNILPLPTSGKPNNFQMVVGDLKGTYKWNQLDTAKLGESFSLIVKFSGNVNLNYLEKIVEEKNKNFNIYSSVSNESEKIISGEYYGTKDFEIAFIPKKTGEIRTPEINVPYFDTKDKKYKNFKIPSRKITVTGSYTDKNYNSEKISNNKINTSKYENKLPKKEIIVSSILEKRDTKKVDKRDILIGMLLLISLGEGIWIFKLIIDKKNDRKEYKDLFKKMLKSFSNKELYEFYSLYMKEKYNFSPKAQFEDILIKNGGNEALINLNRKIEKEMFENIKIDKKEVVSILKANK